MRTLLSFFALVFASNIMAEPVSEKNWQSQPEIVAIRKIYNATKSTSCADFHSYFHFSLQCDADAKVRRITVDCSSGGSGGLREYFYDEKGRLRFIFGQAWPDGDGPIESRTYFREDGSLIYGEDGDEYEAFKNPIHFLVNEFKNADETIENLEDQNREFKRADEERRPHKNRIP